MYCRDKGMLFYAYETYINRIKLLKTWIGIERARKIIYWKKMTSSHFLFIISLIKTIV